MRITIFHIQLFLNQFHFLVGAFKFLYIPKLSFTDSMYPEESAPDDSSKLRVHLTEMEEDFLREAEVNGIEHKYLSVIEAEERI